ncbi:MAG: ribonuclease P protein component [Phycisphaerales bacterium]|nr:ribonuclease P protein component [Phycisphaerales bacterium]
MPFGFDRSRRLRHRTEFDLVYADGRVVRRGPVRIHGLANGLDHHRLGLSVPRRAGNAVRRNRMKRLLREAFRRMQDDGPRGYDLVITLGPHEPHLLAEYQKLLARAVQEMNRAAS